MTAPSLQLKAAHTTHSPAAKGCGCSSSKVFILSSSEGLQRPGTADIGGRPFLALKLGQPGSVSQGPTRSPTALRTYTSLRSGEQEAVVVGSDGWAKHK